MFAKVNSFFVSFNIAYNIMSGVQKGFQNIKFKVVVEENAVAC